MNLYEFNLLEINAQAELLWEEGVYLLVRQEAGYMVNLHALNSFFVEVWYNGKKNKIERIRAFKSREQLEPYIDDIDLEKLLPTD